MPQFRWNEWNVEHIAEHGLLPAEAEAVVWDPERSYPRYQGDGKWLVRGQTYDGRYVQALYILDPDDTVYVIHARPLTEREKRQLRRRRR